MPPKKGKKKGAGKSKKKAESNEVKQYITPVILPPVTETKSQSLNFAVNVKIICLHI